MNSPEPDVVMTVDEVAQFLRLAKTTVYQLARDGELPGRKAGGQWRFSRRELQRWLAGLDRLSQQAADEVVERDDLQNRSRSD